MIKAEIIKDSISEAGARITTFVLTYPRFIHSEFMTHRVFSRNASSSRAIPVKKQIQMVIDNPVIPVAFTKNKAGMQGGDVLDRDSHDTAVREWLYARDWAVYQAKKLADLEVHKQYANRLLEPFAHITVVVTATEFDNFYALRCHEMAQPEIRILAEEMSELHLVSKPKLLKAGEWHLPFVKEEETNGVDLIMRSVARCARVSYLNHEGKESTLEEDKKLFDRLLGSSPIHASPAEHQAMSIQNHAQFSGNFRGWVQYRKLLRNENITKFQKSE